jgi:hypothetical protein
MGASGPMGAREAARGEGKGERLAEDLCLRLACRLASERLGGALIVAEGVPALELELPNAAFRLRETPGLTGTPVRQSPAPSAG